VSKRKNVKPTFTVALDDSGGIEPLVKWDGTLIPGDHPITVLMAVMLDNRRKDYLEENWTKLRVKIQRELSLSYLPPIHMRLMWGRNLPKYIKRDLLNPYSKTTFEQIKEWVAEALSIIQALNQSRALACFYSSINREQIVLNKLQPYFSDPRFVAELKFIRAHSRARFSKMYRVYHNRIASPLLDPLSRVLPLVNETMRIKGSESTEVLIDSFGDSHGIDSKVVVGIIKERFGLSYLTNIERVFADNSVLCQVADVLGFYLFRRELGNMGHIQFDNNLFSLTPKNIMTKRLLDLDMEKLVRQRYPEYNALTLSIHYAIARNALAGVNSEFASKYLVSVDEFYERAKEVHLNRDIGVSILIDPSVVSRLAPKNGDDPG
jgi:hypothetical protein